jgi:hypothetical protein
MMVNVGLTGKIRQGMSSCSANIMMAEKKQGKKKPQKPKKKKEEKKEDFD